MTPFALLLVKITVPPVLVALMSLAARRWGPTVGGLILGLPWMTGPVLFVLGLEYGTPYLVAAARGAELAVWGMSAFMLGLGYGARVMGWLPSLGTAVCGFGAVAAVTQTLDVPLWLATLVAVATLAATYRLLPLPASAAVPGPLPWWDIPARMVATVTLVSIIAVSADLLGPQRSGILASFPVIMTVIGVFTLRQWGADALLRVLRGAALSLQAFVGFFAVVGLGAPLIGQIAAYLAAAATATVISGAFIFANGRVRRLHLRQ